MTILNLHNNLIEINKKSLSLSEMALVQRDILKMITTLYKWNGWSTIVSTTIDFVYENGQWI